MLSGVVEKMKNTLVVVLILMVMNLVACDSDSSNHSKLDVDSIQEIDWLLVEYGYESDTKNQVLEGSRYEINFAKDGSYTGYLDCNSIFGSYTYDSDSISISFPATTKMLCGSQDVSGYQEEVTFFTDVLSTASSYAMYQNQLIISSPDSAQLIFVNTEIDKKNTLESKFSISVGDDEKVEVSAESLSCVYRQAIGASNQLSLQLHYHSSPNKLAFGLSTNIENAIPTSPFVASAGQYGAFRFYVVSENSAFHGTLKDSEIIISLDDLPSTSILNEGDSVLFKGNLLISDLVLKHTSNGDEAETSLVVNASNVEINCDTEYQVSLVLD